MQNYVQWRCFNTYLGVDSACGVMELPRVASLFSLTVVPNKPFTRVSINDGPRTAELPQVLMTVGPTAIGHLSPNAAHMEEFTLANIASLASMQYTNGGIRNVWINPPRPGAVPMVVTGEYRVNFNGGSVNNVYDNLYLGPVTSIGELTFNARGTVNSFVVNAGGTVPLVVATNVRVTTAVATTFVRTANISRLVSAGSIGVSVDSGVLETLVINTPGECTNLDVGGAVTIAATSTSSYITLPVIISGLARVRGKVTVTSSGPQHAGASLDYGADSCGSGLVIEQGIEVSTPTAVGAFTGVVNITRVASVAGDLLFSALSPNHRGVNIRPRSGTALTLLGSVRAAASGATAVLAAIRIGPVTECRALAVEAALGSIVSAVELTALPGDAINMRGGLTVLADGARSTITNVTLTSVGRITGFVAVTVRTGATLTAMSVTGPAASAFDVVGPFTVVADGTIRDVVVSNIQTVDGDVSITGAGSLLKASITAPATAFVGLQITGALTVTATALAGQIRDTTLSPLSQVGGAVFLGTGLDKVTLNSATGPMLTFLDDLTLGTGALDLVSGAVTINNLVAVQHFTLYHNFNRTSVGDVTVVGHPTERLTVFGDLTVVLHKQVIQRKLVVTNVFVVHGNTSVYAVPNADLFDGVGGPVQVNGRPLNRFGDALYAGVAGNDDPSCINRCNGRGAETFSQLSCALISSTVRTACGQGPAGEAQCVVGSLTWRSVSLALSFIFFSSNARVGRATAARSATRLARPTRRPARASAVFFFFFGWMVGSFRKFVFVS